MIIAPAPPPDPSLGFQAKALFSHSRTILVARLYGAASVILVAHDYILPYFLKVDWTPITAHFPIWAVPLAGAVTNAVFEWLRNVTTQSLDENKADAVVAEVKADVKPTTTLPP